ncbi:conserved hypothetical protein [Pediculus humanus corporis]|uniref:Uncharacterized protein n=1 Tax=Pediculus humanus subsp. corporis TaxID=121224 RepID=E0VE26_PEDHC|nr:uncharacterized protein Phum_PHUM127950 [Pediculus humanus corporis]EEB11632.1 conserved hypothetical protein [Pediculus humanus corporis]
MREGGDNMALKLKGVVGYKGRQNDVIYCHPLEKTERTAAVIYFGGDIQDFRENMQSTVEKSNKKGTVDEDNKNCLKWNLDHVATLLGSSFPTSHIIVVRPARMEFRMFSCFDNFVPSNNCGVPEHTPTHYALHHLEELLKCISDRVRTKKRPVDDSALEDGEIMGSPEQGEWWSQDLDLDMCNLTLIGFSKGCVVLNQFIYEFHYLKTLTPDNEILGRFVDRITDMYWLDGGHPGHKNTWITSRCLLETLSRLGIKIHVHVTPYQVRDERRAWIGNEQKMFSELLRAAGAEIEESIHFENETPTLQNHFQVLTAFRLH